MQNHRISLLLLIALFFSTSTYAGTIYWTGDQNSNWSTNNASNTNWATALAGTPDYTFAPQTGDSLIFAATGGANLSTINNDMSGLSVNQMQFTMAGVTLGGNTVTLTSIATTANNTALWFNQTTILNLPITLGTGTIYFAHPGSAVTLTLNGNIDGAGTLRLDRIGATNTTATVTLTGSNTFAGGFQLGTRVTANANSVNALANGSVALIGAGTSNSTLVIGTVNQGITDLSCSGVSTLTTNTNLTVSGTLSVSSAQTLTKNGTGVLLLNGGTGTGTGTLSISAGTVTLGATGTVGASLGAIPVSLTTGTFSVAPGVTTTTNNSIGSSLTLAAGTNFTMADGFTNTFDVAGTATLAPASGASPTLTFNLGGTTTNVDKLAIAGAATVGAAKATIAVTFIGTTAPTPGTYTIITAASGLTTSNFALAAGRVIVNNVAYSISLTGSDTALQLVVGAVSGPVALYWSGSQGGTWNTNNAGMTNWNTDATSGTNSGLIPNAVTDVFFSTTAPTPANLSTTLGADFTVNSLNLDNSASAGLTISAGNTLTILNGGIVSSSATANRNLIINCNVVVSGASQTWSATGTTTALIQVGGNLSGTTNITLSSGVQSNSNTNLPNIRLSGSNSAFTGTITTPGVDSIGYLLGNASAQTGGLFDAANGNRNLWLTGGAGSGTYTFGTDSVAGAANMNFRNAGTAGLYLTGGDATWDPGNGGNYTWAPGTNSLIRLNGSIDATPRMLFWGSNSGNLVLNGDRSITNGTGGNNPALVTLNFALADDATGGRTFTSGSNLTVLTRPAVNTGATASKTVISAGVLAISDNNRLFAGNLDLANGVLLLDNMTWSTFATARPWSATSANNKFTLNLSGTAGNSGGFAARTLDVTIDGTGTTASTFDRDLKLGSSVLGTDGNFYANRVVTIATNTTYTTRRTIASAASGPGLTGAAGSGIVQRFSGALNDSGAGASRGALNFTSTGTVSDSAIPEIVLSGSNSMTGSAFGAINSNNINTGPGGMLILDTDVFVRFDGDGSLPTGTGGNNSYIWVARRNSTPNRSGYLLTGSVGGQTYDLAANQKFVFAALGNSELNSTFGSTGGLATLQNSAIVQGLPRSTNILVRDGTLTLGSGVGPVTFQAGATASTADTGVQGAANAITDDATTTRTLVKRGIGTLVLNNVAYTLPVAGTDIAASVTWTLGTAIQGVFDGAVQETGTSSSNSMSAVKATLQGGVIEFATTPRTVTFGTGVGQININNTTGGGFSAVGGDRTITATNSGLTWSSAPFITGVGSAMYFGSPTADSTAEFTNSIVFNGGTRFFYVIKGTSSTAPEGKLSGVLSGAATTNNLVLGAAKHPNGTFLAPGSLLLTGLNSYQGTTTINAGRLLIGIDAPNSSAGALGNASSAVLLGNTSGSLDAALLTNGAFTVGRPVTVQAGNTGTITLGGNTAATSSFNGAITLNKDLAITAASSGTVNVTGAISGSGAINKTGAGTVVLSATSGYTGATTVSAGTLAGTAVLSASGVTVASGTTLAPGTPAGGTGMFTADTADFSAGGKLRVRITNASNDLLQVTNTNVMTTALKMAGGELVVDLSSFDNTLTPNTFIVVAQGPSWSSSGFSTITLNPINFPATVRYVNNGSGTNTSKQVIVALNGNTTPVKVADFNASPEAFGANIYWTAVSEFQNAGFNLYRRALESSAWMKVNPALIAGRITSADELQYNYFDWTSPGLYEYRLESVAVDGALEVHPQLSNSVSVDWDSDLASALSVTPDVVAGAARSFGIESATNIASQTTALFAAEQTRVRDLRLNVSAREIAMDSEARQTQRAGGTPATWGVGVRWFSAGSVGAASGFSAAKVTYSGSGVLLIPQAAMPAGCDLSRVSIQREGRNVTALAQVPGGLLVHAPGYKDDYTNKDALFLRSTSAPTKAGSVSNANGLFTSPLPVQVVTSSTVTNDYHDVYFDYGAGFRPYTFEPWFSNKYLTSGSAQNFTVSLPHAAGAPGEFTVNLWSLTSGDHVLQVAINGQAVGESSWNGGQKMMRLSFTAAAGVLKSGDNIVTLSTPALPGISEQTCFVHSIKASYTRKLDASAPFEVTNDSGVEQLYELNNVPATGAWIVDTRFSDRAALVPTESLPQADGSLRVRFKAAAGGSGKFVVALVGAENRPLSVSARQVKALRLNGTYLATGPAQFASGVQPLLMKRSREGIRGLFVDQEQLFDYYNYGRYGPDAIRGAVRSTRPAYLLLVGRTTYDYLNYEGQNIDPLCPAYLVSTSFWAQSTSDSAFGDLGRGYPEVAVGRLPVNNPTELSGAVNHIITYKGLPATGARLHAVADKADPTVANFGLQLDTALKSKHPDLTWQENYLERTYQTAPEVTAALNLAANGGADLILYSGHGNAARLGAGAPSILDQNSVQEWKGNTVFLQATCTANWMAKNVNDYKSIAIQALTQAQGGIAASVGTSTYMNSDVATAFMNQLLTNTNQPGARWGAVLLKTQRWAGAQSGNDYFQDLMKTEQLFGDPAMPVFAPGAAPQIQNANQPGTF